MLIYSLIRSSTEFALVCFDHVMKPVGIITLEAGVGLAKQLPLNILIKLVTFNFSNET